MKGKIFWAGAALLCCLDKNLSREQREERLLILFAAKRTASLLLLPLIVILCRPAQDTGDPAPSVLLWMEKQQQESQPSWMILHFRTKKQQRQQKLHVLKEMRRYFTHPKPCTAPGSIKCRHSGVNLLYKQPKLEWNCSSYPEMMFWDVAAECLRIPRCDIWQTAWFDSVWTCHCCWIQNRSCVEFELFINTHKRLVEHV